MLLTSIQTRDLLEQYSIPVPSTVYANSFGELVEKAQTLSFPLVLKVASPDATHKTERGLVQLGIRDFDELLLEFRQVEKKAEDLSIDAFVLQEQVKGVEFIIGGKKDPVFGQTLLFGLGGVLTELLGDYSIRICPLKEKDVLQLMSETKANAFFQGFRGKKASRPKIVDVMLKTSKLLENKHFS